MSRSHGTPHLYRMSLSLYNIPFYHLPALIGTQINLAVIGESAIQNNYILFLQTDVRDRGMGLWQANRDLGVGVLRGLLSATVEKAGGICFLSVRDRIEYIDNGGNGGR